MASARVRASWARWPPDSDPGPLLRVQAELPDPPLRQLVVPAGVEPGAEAEVIGDPHPGVDGRVLGDEADPGQLRRRWPAGGSPRTLIVPRVGASSPVARLQQGGLARAVGPDEPDDVAFGDGQRAVAQRPGPPVLLAQPAGLDDGGHQRPPRRSSCGTRCGRSPRCHRGPGPPTRAERSQSVIAARNRAWVAGSVPDGERVTNVPSPGRARASPSRSSSR